MIRLLLILSLVCVLVGITYLSLSPTVGLPAGNDKVGHFIAYATLMFNLGLITLKNRTHLWYAVLFSVAYGALMEGLQGLVPGRMMSAYDMLANTLGVSIGLVLTLLFGRRLMKIFSK